ncbi:unnamed protein product [Protopolystoma xenopodis]|uniref:Choline/carnitine acyltransferase domain-containing protein n=1 Tax=Protopolystoma xenopodis TaxID=117903 RepID=A0A3S5CKC1_9PLAT|nr:unnamed protein product [Protopolystoma xenopodis]
MTLNRLPFQQSDDFDLVVSYFTGYGRDFITSCRISPDAYLQAALQLAYRRLHGRLPLTYEPALMRLFRMGRTETVRSLTPAMAEFIE